MTHAVKHSFTVRQLQEKDIQLSPRKHSFDNIVNAHVVQHSQGIVRQRTRQSLSQNVKEAEGTKSMAKESSKSEIAQCLAKTLRSTQSEAHISMWIENKLTQYTYTIHIILTILTIQMLSFAVDKHFGLKQKKLRQMHNSINSSVYESRCSPLPVKNSYAMTTRDKQCKKKSNTRVTLH